MSLAQSRSLASRSFGFLLLFAFWLSIAPEQRLFAEEKPAAPTEDDYYPLTAFAIPDGIVLEAGALTLLPDGRLAVGTRRGEIYFVTDPQQSDGKSPAFKLFASGLHEVLGLAWRDGWLYVTQRCDVSRLKDADGDDRADLFEVFNADWGINGDYHEYAFGSPFDKDGNIWVVLCLTGSFSSEAKYRGWCLRITPDGKSIPTCSGIRSPGGIGMNHLGEMFYTDNQGPWNGSCGLKHLEPGKFVGHPGGFKWYDLTNNAIGPRPTEPKSGSRIMTEAAKIPELNPTCVFFPYSKMGQSASGIACDTTGGKFGPFTNQLFVGDQTHSTVMRVTLEKVQGHYQGACYPFRAGTGSGSLSLLMSAQGKMFVGGTNRGWGSRGPKPFSLDRIAWTGKVPFEIHEMKAQKDGFTLIFTEPVDRESASQPDSYTIETYTYIYQASYGSPEVDQTKPKILSATVAEDGKSVRLVIDAPQIGHVHELHLPGVRNQSGRPVLHPSAYYTLNYLPEN